MIAEKKIVKGWIEPLLKDNPKWRWWTFWQDRYVVEPYFIPDEEGDVEQEMTVYDFENVTMSEGYEQLKALARSGR